MAYLESINRSKPQIAVQVLWALATLGWRDEAGASGSSSFITSDAVYKQLLQFLTYNAHGIQPYDLSIVMYSIARLGRSGHSVDSLAGVVSRKVTYGRARWDGRSITGCLRAWALMSILGCASDELNNMARALFRACSGMESPAEEPLAVAQ